jgi:putative transposase
MCRVLEVSPSGYYARRTRPPSARALANAELSARIAAIHQRSRATYGAPRIQVELREQGIRVGRKRVARLLRAAGLAGVSRRRWVTTTQRDRAARPAPDLVERNFAAPGPNRLWVADITYIPTWAGFLYLAVVLDVFSRRIVGWAMETYLRTELVLKALDMALGQRRPSGVIHHSDQGSQYTSFAFGQRCEAAGVRPSMGSVGDCFDNAMCESFFATLECELLNRRSFKTQVEARMAVFDFIEGWYNPHRRHSALDYLSPINYERSHLQETLYRSPTPSTETG